MDVKEYRRMSGMSVGEFCSALMISRDAYKSYASGRRKAPVDVLKGAKRLTCSVHDESPGETVIRLLDACYEHFDLVDVRLQYQTLGKMLLGDLRDKVKEFYRK